MADGKRKTNCDSTDKRKRKYRSDGTPVWGRGSIEGPGVWISCVKGKEKQTVGEIYALFDSLASELWPIENEGNVDGHDGCDSDHGDDSLSVEAQIADELAAIKRPRKGQRFTNCPTNTPCVVFISCKPPVDPVKLVATHIQNVERTGVTRTRNTHRLVPVSGNCVANLPEIQSLCLRIFNPFFARDQERKYTYKIELRIRNHTTLSRPTLIQQVAQCVPAGHAVDLTNPEIFILVEVFKSVCGVGIVEDYYRLQKFNVMEISHTRNDEGIFVEEGRVAHQNNLSDARDRNSEGSELL